MQGAGYRRDADGQGLPLCGGSGLKLAFYKEKLVTYSADNWEKISSEKRYNKKHSYSFAIYDEHIFVYDKTAGEMVDRIET